MISRANQALIAVHLLLAVGAVVGAVISFVMFSQVDRASDDGLSGFLIVYGVAGLLFATVVGILGTKALRARTSARAASFSLPLGLTVLFLALLPATFMFGYQWWWQLAGAVSLVLPLALVVTSSLLMWRPTPSPRISRRP